MGKDNSVAVGAAHWLVGDNSVRHTGMKKSELIVSIRVSVEPAMRKRCVKITEHKTNTGNSAFDLARS